MEMNINIGPFMVVNGKLNESIEIFINTCSDEYCYNFKNNKELKTDKFCSICGSEVKSKKYKEEYKTSPYDFFYELAYKDDTKIDENDLTWTDPMGCGGGVFISNKFSPFDTDSRNDVEGALDLSNANQNEEKKWFIDEYKEIIDHMKKAFGEKNVIISWGVVKWYS